ncbi:MAG TPA: tail fiber domain-containing protein, partial [Saprospiraceae bacterium]|nr:tail fiber domain-containing protein [Saprospiraceae bacterium]
GRSAGFSNTSGNDNAFFGRSAGIGNMTGTRNTCIGRNANVSSNNLTNATSLGYNASANASHKVRIGSTAVTVIEGQVDWSFPSDARFKINVQDENIPGLEFISLLRPVTYQFDFRKFDQHITKNYPDSVKQEMFSNKDYSKSEHVMKTGFLAQEVEEACNRLGYHFDGLHVPESNVDNYSLAYASFVPLLIKGVQEQQEMIDAQELKINEQESEIEQLKSNQQLLEDHMAQQDDRIAHLESLVQQLLENKSEEKIENPADLHVLTHPQLMQNEPNPFNGMTRIHYFIPEDVSSQTVLIISALDGREIKRITLTQKGHGAVEIDAQLLPSGIYLYSLVIGHSLIDTKKMVHQR